MKTTYTLQKPDGSKESFDDKQAFDRASRKLKREQERTEEHYCKNQHLAKLYACENIVELTNEVEQHQAKHLRFDAPEPHCAPNGYLQCKVHRNTVLAPDPTQKDFASLLGVGLVDRIVFNIMDDAVAFKHFRGLWFTIGVECGALYSMELPKSLGEKLDALAGRKE